MKPCFHVECCGFVPERVEIVEEGNQRISGGEVTSTTYTEVIYRCPLCKQLLDAPIEEEENE
jgi:hypothetical protein